MRNVKLWAFIAAVVLVIVLDRVFGWSGQLLDGQMTETLSSLMSERPVLAALLFFVLSFVGSVALALPGVLFAIAAGALFGPVEGTLLCWGSMSFGASASFLIGRFFLQDSLKPKLQKSPALNRLLFEGADRSDAYLLATTRLVPIFPFNLQNFAYGITDIRFSRYTLFTAIFILPGTAVYTLASAGVVDPSQRTVCFVAAAALLVLVLVLAWVLKRRENLQ